MSYLYASFEHKDNIVGTILKTNCVFIVVIYLCAVQTSVIVSCVDD